MRALNSVIGIFALVLALTTASSWASEIDREALRHEFNKRIIPLDSAEIERQYRLYQQGMDDLDRYDDGQDDFNDGEYAFDEDDSSQEQGPIDAQPINIVDDTETQIQINIRDQILAFESENKIYGPQIKEIRRCYIKKAKEIGSEVLPSDIARLDGNFLDNKDEYDLAIKFYTLAAESYRSGGEEHLAAGAMLVRYFNSEVARSKPKAPTSELFAAVRKATWHYGCGSMACEIGDYFVDALKRVRDMMVRWPVSPQHIQNDNFYTYGTLLERLYSVGFVDALLKDVRKFEKVFKAYKYDASLNEGNLLNELYEAGFYGIRKWYGNKPQYVWVNPQGYIVRIKFNSAEHRWEFTVGLSYVNPLKWQGEKARGVKTHRDLDPNAKAPYYRKVGAYDDLVAYEFNEIFKIVIDDKLVMVTPATMQRYWLDRFVEQKQIMAQAHRPLLPIKKTAAVDVFCGF